MKRASQCGARFCVSTGSVSDRMEATRRLVVKELELKIEK
jgi:hypothetical protein